MVKNLYFISDSIPNNHSFGSEIIFFRHLTRFSEAGYDITICTSRNELLKRNKIDFPMNWKVKTFYLENFFPFWFLKRFRCFFHLAFLIEFFLNTKLKKPDLIFSYLWGIRLFTFAAFLSNWYKCKLYYFIHDDNRHFFNPNAISYIENLNQYCFKRANLLLCVTKGLGESLVDNDLDRKKIKVVLPIPEALKFDNIILTRKIKENKLVIFSGSIYPAFFILFKLIDMILDDQNGHLNIITKNSRKYAELIIENKLHRTSINDAIYDTKEAIIKLNASKGILLVGYPDRLEELKWTKFSFPSKLIEYAFLGLPCLIITPKDTELYLFCTQVANLDVFTPDETDKIADYLSYLSTENGWNENIRKLNDLSLTLFSPERIHKSIPIN